jgi:hypothetical protein
MLGKQTESWKEVAVGMEVREVAGEWASCVRSFGCIDGGYELARLAWPKLEHRWSIRRPKENVDTGLAAKPAQVHYGHDGHHRFPKKLLRAQPVDLLLVERGHIGHAPKGYSPDPWEELVESTPPGRRPKLIIESWSDSAQTWLRGPVCKATVTPLARTWVRHPMPTLAGRQVWRCYHTEPVCGRVTQT